MICCINKISNFGNFCSVKTFYYKDNNNTTISTLKTIEIKFNINYVYELC